MENEIIYEQELAPEELQHDQIWILKDGKLIELEVADDVEDH